MSMQRKCDYCGNYFEDTLEKCPSCGAPNDHIARSANEQPKTITQLQQWVKDHKLPSEQVTRFFIGKNVKERRAFGIYKDEDSGNFVVYKNKDNGQRAIRYEGKDEKYAVNEIYQRLKAEISNQKTQAKTRNHTSIERNKHARRILLFCILLVLFILGITFVALNSMHTEPSGYYNYQGAEYYDTNLDDNDSNFQENYNDYYSGSTYDSDYGANYHDSDYYDSSYSYTDDNDWGSDWDNDSSWDSNDSWDSGGSDWDSDW